MSSFDSEVAPEARIALAVIEQAFRDIRSPRIQSGRHGSNATPVLREVHEARQFLTSEGGAWAASRHAYCAMAGLHPETVREIALRDLAPQIRPDQAVGGERGR